MKFTKKALLASVLTMFAANVNALLIAEISDTADFSGTVVQAIDTDGDGFLSINSGLGTWVANVVTGLSSPLLGGNGIDEMDLNSVNVSGGTGTIYIRLSDTGFSKLDASYTTSFGGTTNGSVSFQSYVDSSNTHFGTGTLLSESGDVSTAAYSGISYGDISMNNLYSMTIYAAISHTEGFQVSSFDYNIKVPEPATAALLALGLGFLGFGAARRKKT